MCIREKQYFEIGIIDNRPIHDHSNSPAVQEYLVSSRVVEIGQKDVGGEGDDASLEHP